MTEEKKHFVLIWPDVSTPETRRRIQGIADAIQLAGAEAQILSNHYGYSYPQDFLILIGDYAFFPSEFGKMPEGIKKFVEHFKLRGFHFMDLGVLPGKDFDGGNVVCDHAQRRFLMGVNNFTAQVDVLEDDIRRAAALMSAVTGYDSRLVEMSHIHQDSCVGVLPNGKLLVKLDEGGTLYRMGVTALGLKQLLRDYDRSELITFSFDPHPDADYVLNPQTAAEMRCFDMLTNFITVGNTVIGEEFPEPLAGDLKKDGIKFIAPKDVRLKTFVMPGDEGFKGGVRCSALETSSQGSTRVPTDYLRAKLYSPEL